MAPIDWSVVDGPTDTMTFVDTDEYGICSETVVPVPKPCTIYAWNGEAYRPQLRNLDRSEAEAFANATGRRQDYLLLPDVTGAE